MKVFRYLLLSGLGLAVFVCSEAQTVDQVINKHIEALGGKAKLLSLNSLYQEMTMESSFLAMITSKNWQVKGRLWRMEVTFGNATSVTVVTPGKGWVYNPLAGSISNMTDKELKASQVQLSTTDQLVDYAAKGSKVVLLKKDTACGRVCYPVVCTLSSGIVITYFIDVKTGYTLRQAVKGGNGAGSNGNARGEAVIDFSDYRPEGGIMLAHALLVGVVGPHALKMTVTKVEVNKPVDVEGLSRSK